MTTHVHPADYPRIQAKVDEAVRNRTPLRMDYRVVLSTVRSTCWRGQDATSPFILEPVLVQASEATAEDNPPTVI